MNFTFDQLLDLADSNLQRAEEFDIEHSAAYASLAIGYALIAIAQELHRMNSDKMPDKKKESWHWPMSISDLGK